MASIAASPTIRSLELERAAALIAELGFVLVHDAGGDGDRSPGSHLVVALRERPTTTHFDPERMSCWIVTPGDIAEIELDRMRLPEQPAIVSWGAVRLVDRFGVPNTFLTFGGTLRAFAGDPETRIVVIDSAAPILRWSGHSQEVDPLALEVAVFFARLRLPIAVEAASEARITRITPVALYAAFVADLRARYHASPALEEIHQGTAEWLAHEARRLESTAAADWEDGQRLLEELGWTQHA